MINSCAWKCNCLSAAKISCFLILGHVLIIIKTIKESEEGGG